MMTIFSSFWHSLDIWLFIVENIAVVFKELSFVFCKNDTSWYDVVDICAGILEGTNFFVALHWSVRALFDNLVGTLVISNNEYRCS